MTDQTRTPTITSATPPAAGYVLLAMLSVVWGVNWPVMKIVLAEVPVWWFRSICLIAGGLGLLSIAIANGSRIMPRGHEWGPLLLTATFAVLGWHVCSGFGVSLMPAGRAAIIAFTMPVWAALAASWLLGERVTALKVTGLALGLAGLAVLIGPDLVVFQTAPAGALFMLGAALSWGLGTVLFKRFAWSIPVVANMGLQLLCAAIPVTVIAAAQSPPPDPAMWSMPVAMSMAYVLLLPMTFGQWAYFKIVRLFPASIAAIGTLMIPVIGVYSSSVLLDEKVGVPELVALGLTCAALAIILLGPILLAQRNRRTS